MAGTGVDDVDMSVTLDAEGFLHLDWSPGVTVTGEAARRAVAKLAQVASGRERPLLVDMTATGGLTRDARVVFAEKSAASRVALLGRSSVDRVIANFFLGVGGAPVPTRFFTSESAAVAWLRDGHDR